MWYDCQWDYPQKTKMTQTLTKKDYFEDSLLTRNPFKPRLSLRAQISVKVKLNIVHNCLLLYNGLLRIKIYKCNKI